MRHKTSLVVTMALLSLLSSCSPFMPTYERPRAPVDMSRLHQMTAAQRSAEAAKASDLPWQLFIKNPGLSQTIEIGLINNRDLRQALANIEAARANYRIQQAEEFPIINANFESNRSKNIINPGVNGSTVMTKNYSATVGLSAFEIDLFGKKHSLSEAEFETFLSTAASARSTQITLIAEISSAWAALATDQSLLKLAQQTMENSKKAVDLTRQRLNKGIASRVDLRQAETIYHQARYDIETYSTLVMQDRNALELLVGGAISNDLLPDGMVHESDWFADVPMNLSSDVLLQRPDVLAAEHTLKSANANIGAARAAFFPSISLTTNTGIGSLALSGLFGGGATHIWSFIPTVTLPIFDLGAWAGLDYVDAQYKVYLAQYEFSIQTAFREVADALARQQTLQDQFNAQRDLVAASSDLYLLANSRYTQGVDTYLNALIAQRTLYAAEQAMVSLRQTSLNNRITLYKVLGGGVANSLIDKETSSQESNK